MNALNIDAESSRILIDQLVAHELDETTRAQLIQWLEESPDRWRDLGLAFLEAQVWTKSFAELETGVSLSTQLATVRHPAMSQARRMGLGLVIAACLLGAWLGIAKWMEYQAGPQPAQPGLARHDSTADLLHSPAASNGNRAESAMHSLDRATSSGLEINAFRRDETGRIERIRVPVATARSTSQQRADSDKIVRSLQQRGFDVKREQRYLPAMLPDGRKVMLPFHQLMANYVGKAVY